jgi:hypothetical protein
MHTTGMSFKAIGRQMGYHYTIQPTGEKTHTNQQHGSRLTNGSCAMSLISNHVVLNTMPNVIVDVGLTTVDV